MNTRTHRQAGVVSLFVVIFATLLMTVVTVGFIQLMLKDQRQATTNDLSQSAYDAAQAGVEDAKRLLLLDQACREGVAAPTIKCAKINAALTPAPGQSATNCDTLVAAELVNATNDETLIQQNTGDNAAKLDQAYTCVKVSVDTADYKNQVSANQSVMVPIAGVGTFDTVEISWFSKEDVPGTTDQGVEFPSKTPETPLPRVGSLWAANMPALLRAQLIQTGASFKLSDFNDNQGSNSNANTLFLYPSYTGAVNLSFALDGRRLSSNAPRQAKCANSFIDNFYACTATITLPSPINGNAAQRSAFLRLGALYNGAHFSVKLKNGANDVKFSRVQPEVDATGRANDVFRRVVSRIELKGNFIYPQAAIDMQGDLCKNFTVTDAESGYVPSTTCTP